MAPLQERQAALVNAMSGGFAGGVSPSQGFQPPESGRTLASDVPDPITARAEMGPGPSTDRVNPSQINERRQSASPGAAAGRTSPEAASGHDLSPSEVAAGGVVAPTVQGGRAAMAHVQADGLDERARSAESNLSKNAPPEAASPAFNESSGQSNIDKLKALIGLGPQMPQGGGGGGRDSSGPNVTIQRDWKDNSQEGWDMIPMLPPEAGRQEFDARLAAVQQQLPNSSEAVQTAVAAADMHASRIQMGGAVANQIDAQLSQLTHEEWDQVKQFTDLRSGDQRVKIESLRQEADNLRGGGGNPPTG